MNYKLAKICPNCKSELTFSLKKQILGNNCDCGFPRKSQRTLLGRIKILLWLKLNEK